MVLLLLNYYRCLRTISEAPEQRVEGGQVSHSWCMCVVIAMVGWVETGMEVVDGMYAGQNKGGGSHVGRCRSTSRERDEDTDNTRSHRRPSVQH